MSVNIYLEQKPSAECSQTGKACQWSIITEKTKIATLTGDNCVIDCQLEGVSSTALLDAFNFSEKHPKNELSDH